MILAIAVLLAITLNFMVAHPEGIFQCAAAQPYKPLHKSRSSIHNNYNVHFHNLEQNYDPLVPIICLVLPIHVLQHYLKKTTW